MTPAGPSRMRRRAGRRPSTARFVATIVVGALLLPTLPFATDASPATRPDRVGASGSGNTTGPPPISGWWRLHPAGASPPNRTDGQMTYVSESGYVVLFGGCPGYGLLGTCRTPLADTWEYRGGAWSNVTAGGPPPGRAAAAFADDPADGYAVLFGGIGANGTMNDTWTFSNGAWTQLHPVHPPPRLGFAAMAYDPNASELVLVGGIAPGSLTANPGTWTFRGGEWTNGSLAPQPPAWVAPYLSVGPGTGGLVLFGGVSAEIFPTYAQQTWEFHGGRWSNVTASAGASGPGARAWALGGYDPLRNVSWMYGGGAGGASVLGDLWEWGAHNQWRSVPLLHGPLGALYQTASAWDDTDGYLVEFGEESLGSYYGIPTIQSVTNETWALLSTLEPGAVVSVNSTTTGRPVEYSASPVGGLPPYSYGWTFGDETTATAANGSHAYSVAGSYNVTLTVTDSVGQSATFRATMNVTTPPSPGGSVLGAPTNQVAELAAAVLAGIVAVAAVVWWRRRRGRIPTAEAGAVPGPAPERPEGFPRDPVPADPGQSPAEVASKVGGSPPVGQGI